MTVTPFGTLDGRDIREVTLSTADAEAKIIEYGAVVRDLEVRKADGTLQRVVLGLNSVEDYVQHAPHFGAIAGRYANRIRGGRFTLDGETHQLLLNQDGRHHLHGGGPKGFGKQPWTLVHHDVASATLVHISPDGTNGYPGTAHVTCRYTLAGKTLRIELWATTDKATPVNLCHHSYFNLDGSTDTLDHTLMLRANVMTPVDVDLIPDGSLAPVSGTPFDFRVARPVRLKGKDGERVWYDHNFVLRRDRTEPSVAAGLDVAHAATFASPRSGLKLDVWTTEPALQVYDGFKLALPVPGLDGIRYGANAGLCLEPQHMPDSPNLPHFPSTILRPGDLYRQVTEYRFG
jgi:aldose 1-epimerase